MKNKIEYIVWNTVTKNEILDFLKNTGYESIAILTSDIPIVDSWSFGVKIHELPDIIEFKNPNYGPNGVLSILTYDGSEHVFVKGQAIKKLDGKIIFDFVILDKGQKENS